MPKFEFHRDHNGDCKILNILEDGLKVESLIIESRKTFPTIYCISSQAGCPIGCTFCNNGSRKFYRNLSPKEIIDQVKVGLDLTTTNLDMPFCVTFMGVGEPLYNLQNIKKAVKGLINRYSKLCSMSLSTIGIPDKVYDLSGIEFGKPLYLQFSLHSPFEKEREQLFQSNLPKINESLNSLIYYANQTKTEIWVNYILIRGVNDSDKHISEICRIIDKKKFKIKVSTYIPIVGSKLKPASAKEIGNFINKLKMEGYHVVHRKNAGVQIGGACGHLIAKR